MFNGHPYIDPENKVYLKMGRKTRMNDIDTRHVSPEMMAIAQNPHSLTSVMLGLKYNLFDDHTLDHGMTFKASLETCSDSRNSSFLKAKASVKGSVRVNDSGLLLSGSLRASTIKGLSTVNNLVPVNDRAHLLNFKGIR